MKSFSFRFLALPLALTLVPASQAQTAAPVAPPSPAALAAAAAAKALTPDDRVLSLAWTDTTRSVQILVSNPGTKALQVLGVQSTGGLYVVDYPKTIPAGGSASVSAIYEAKAGTDSDVELIRLKTDVGEKLVRLTLAREPVVTFETKQLKWTVGERLQAKTVLVVLDKGVTIKGVAAPKGHSAEVQKINATSYRIVITPQSTAKATTFPVSVTLDPSVPGIMPFITCSIVSVD